MNDELPRQTYKTEEHERIETAIAERFATWTRCQHLKIGFDPIDKQKARIDRAFYRDGHIIGFAEIKTRNAAFGAFPSGWCVSLKKVDACRVLASIVRVPVLLIVGFSDDTIAYLNCQQEFERQENFGRDDRGDEADREIGARFQWSQFKVLGHAT